MPYSGINILMLWASSVEQGFGSPSWMTFRQALELNAHVREGEPTVVGNNQFISLTMNRVPIQKV
jgi:antirestriction protein ArdC